MGKLSKYAFTIVVVTMLTLSSFLPQVSANGLVQHIEKTVGKGNTSVTIDSVKTGNRVLHVKGDIPRQPASNLKLITGFGALQLLGEQYRFKTEAYTNGLIVNGVLKGHVFLKGYGDPTLQYKDLVKIGQSLKARGIHKIDGHILGDDTYFSGPQLPVGVLPSEETEYYGARVSALTLAPNDDFDAGTIIVEVKPSKTGQKGHVTQLPRTSDVKIINNSVTTKKGSRNTISVKRKLGTNDVVVSGQIPIGSSSKKWVTVKDPTLTTLHYARLAFKQAGIQLGQNSWYWRQAVRPEYKLLHTHKSKTLGEMFPTFMKLSNNVMADSFLKTIGAEQKGIGDIHNGFVAIKQYLDANHIPNHKISMVDGSGLSAKNRLTTNETASLLIRARQMDSFQAFFKSLPVGGVNSRLVGGTLRHRFQGSYANHVVAKTGYIDNVYTLSGYVKTRNGNAYAFSIMANYATPSKVTEIDRFIKHLIDYY